MDTAAWLDQFGASDLSPVEQAQLRERMADAKADAAGQREEAEREAARQDRHEGLLLADRQAGGAMAELSRARAVHTTADDKCRDLEAELAKWQRKRDNASSNIEFWAARMAQVTEQVQRSADVDPAAAAVQRAREVHREFARNTRQALSGVATGRRPKGRGSAVVRSDQPVSCQDCIDVGATPEESFLLHSDPQPVRVPDDAERVTSAGYAELSR
jgi:hypothetical protein